PIGKLGIVDWREDCSNCHNCVKRSCVYGFYRDEADSLREDLTLMDYIYQCKGCLACIQNCTKGLLTRVVNPEYEHLGDSYYTPDIILANWYQAETGNIPVSGSGYGGPFSGPGFDSMWTDMSEIVRPTRDGIHGREYISTSVDIGRKVPYIEFRDGQMSVTPPPLVEIPVPIIFECVPPQFQRGAVVRAVAKAAEKIGTLFIVDDNNADLLEIPGAIPICEPQIAADGLAPIVMVAESADILAVQQRIKDKDPARIVSIRLSATPDSATRISELTRGGAELVHLVFDSHGRETGADNPRHMRDVLREVHRALVKDGIRDLVTLVASGGIAHAEHVAKAIICGADLVAVDLPLMTALECRLCGECLRGETCPVHLDEVEEPYGVQRIVNLMGAWRNQLLELLGAMGIREVRRLRGETGRCMFFEDLEASTFGRLFGTRKQGV
ncbi:MAG: glutamate synthase-related protein, partial [Candidatus Hydrogenedentes bacterium]|nr:glutamate synthase-related protein [Candidatus Hydrogenedentota bacterium]